MIRKTLNVRRIVEQIETQQLRWFEHLNRMEDSSTTKIIWEMGETRKDSTGRRRRKWREKRVEKTHHTNGRRGWG